MNKALGIIGFIAFAIGILVAITFGIFPKDGDAYNIVVILLLILGVVIGLLNITTREMLPLMVSTIALVVVGDVFEPITTLGIGQILDAVLSLIATLMAPAAVISAIRALVSVGFPKD